MTLKTPILITPRLLPGLRIGNAWIAIEYAGATSDGRVRYRYHIDLDGGLTMTGQDLKSGCGGGSLQEGLESLLAFLGAAAEAYRSDMRRPEHLKEVFGASENSDLFPDWVNEWAYTNADEISMAQLDLEENRELIDETAAQ